MTSRTETRPPQAHPLHGLAHSDVFAIAAAALLAWGVGLLVIHQPPRVPRVSIENSSGYNIGVEVRGADEGWIRLGTATKEGITTIMEVIDQGDVWTFRFASQGRRAGELRVERTELETGQWRVQIPDSAIRTLRNGGAQLPP